MRRNTVILLAGAAGLMISARYELDALKAKQAILLNAEYEKAARQVIQTGQPLGCETKGILGQPIRFWVELRREWNEGTKRCATVAIKAANRPNGEDLMVTNTCLENFSFK